MVRRLQDFECESCGHFVLVRKGRGHDPVATTRDRLPGPSTSLHHAAALLETPQPPASRLHSAPTRAERALRFLAYEKAVLLAAILLGLSIGNLLTRNELSQLAQRDVQPAQLMVGAAVLSAMAALVLYIDWGLIKRWMIYLAVILLSVQVFNIYGLADGQHSRLVTKLCFEGTLMLWFIWLLFRDLRNYE